MSGSIDNINYLRNILRIESSWQEANRVWYIYLMTRRKDQNKEHGYDNKMLYRGTILNEKDFDEKTSWLKQVADDLGNCRMYITACSFDLMGLVLHMDNSMNTAFRIFNLSSRKEHMSLQDRKCIIGHLRSSQSFEDVILKPERLLVDLDYLPVGGDPKVRAQLGIMQELLEDYPVYGAYDTVYGRHYLIDRKIRFEIEKYLEEKVYTELTEDQAELFYKHFNIKINPLALLYYAKKKGE